MRPIDADAKITALLYDEEHEETNRVEMTIADFIDSYTEEGCPQIGGWISVKDKLPEVDTNVVVYAEGKNDPIYRIVITSMSDRNIFDPRIKREPYWREPWQFFDTMYEITHWMPIPPLPEPPTN